MNNYRKKLINECLDILNKKISINRSNDIITFKRIEIHNLQLKLEALFQLGPRGRTKGTGRFQKFIKSKGGKTYLDELYNHYRSVPKIAEHFLEHDGFYCALNSIWYTMRFYGIKSNRVGRHLKC